MTQTTNRLSADELRALELIASGLPPAAVGERLALGGEETARLLAGVRRKTGAHSRTAAARCLVELYAPSAASASAPGERTEEAATEASASAQLALTSQRAAAATTCASAAGALSLLSVALIS